MRNRASLVALFAVIALPAVAAAQPAGGGGYYAGGAPVSPFHPRGGTAMGGFSIGLGGMNVNGDEVECASCDYSPIGVEFDAHIGGMLSDRFGLALELQVNAETIEDSAYETSSLAQSTVMISGQYWINRQLWVKGGLGLSHLSVEGTDYYGDFTEPVDDGAAIMAGVGYELFSSPTFGLDLQGRFVSAGYDGIGDRITALTVGVGFNWYSLFGGGGALIVVH